MFYKFIGLVCASSLPFLFSLHGEFVFDDSEAIVKNSDITSQSWLNPFQNDFWGTSIKSNLSHKSYRPLTILSFRVNYHLNNQKLTALQFKITNLICHVICCLLVWQTLKIILCNLGFGNSPLESDLAYSAALLFAVHPIHVEAVCGIVGRADILAAITFFLAFLLYDKSVNSTRFTYIYLGATVTLAAISMLFKENGVTVLGFCISYEVVAKFKIKKKIVANMKNHTSYKDNNLFYLNIKSIIRIVIIFIAVVIILYQRWAVMGGTKPKFNSTDNPAAYSKDLFTKVATCNYIYFLNLLLLIWPQWLCYDWSMGCIPLVESILDHRILLVLSMYIYAVLLVITIFRRNKGSTKRLIILAISLSITPFLPATNILYPVGFVIAERILYISSAGYCLLVCVGLERITQFGYGNRRASVVLFSVLIASYALRSWQRSYDWQNEYQLYVSALSVCPLNAKVHYNVAKVADAKRQTAWALDEYKKAIRLYPKYYQAMNNLANLLKSHKEYPEAEYYLRKAVSIKRDFPAAWMNLGIVLASTRRYEESLNAYKTALEHRRNYPDCLYNLGNLYLELNRTEEAMDNWFKAIHLNQTHVLAWTNLLALLDNTGQMELALQIIPKALTELSSCPSVNFAVANIYGKLERYSEAERYFIQAIELFDGRVQAIHYANLGVLYHRWKKYDRAEQMYINALKIDPMFKSAQTNLKSVQKFKMKK